MTRLNVGNIRHPDGTNDNISLDSSGRVGIGTSSPGTELHVIGASRVESSSTDITYNQLRNTSTNGRTWTFATTGSSNAYGIPSAGYFFLRDSTAGEHRLVIDTSGNLQFNSGYGSVATAYGCRAWVNFDGTSGSIGSGRANGNVTSITDNGTGDYTVNFTTAMPDANYSYALSGRQVTSVCGHLSPHTFATGSLRFQTFNVDDTPGIRDYDFVSVAIFR